MFCLKFRHKSELCSILTYTFQISFGINVDYSIWIRSFPRLSIVHIIDVFAIKNRVVCEKMLNREVRVKRNLLQELLEESVPRAEDNYPVKIIDSINMKFA